MALGHRDLNFLTREQVAKYLENWEVEDPKPDLRTYLMQRLNEVQPGIGNEMVDVSQRDDINGDEAKVIDLIMEDIDSYYPPKEDDGEFSSS